MNDTFLYTLPQWIIFAGIIGVTYGWVENKKPFRLIGCFIFIILGIYSAYIISGDYFAASKFLTPDELASLELEDEIINEIPFEAKLLPGYWAFIVSALLAIPALYYEWKDKKPGKILIVCMGIIALLGFFIIVGAVKSL